MSPGDTLAAIAIAGLYVLFVGFFAIVRGRDALRQNARPLVAIAAGIVVLVAAERMLETLLGGVVLFVVPVAFLVVQLLVRARRSEQPRSTAAVPVEVAARPSKTAVRVFIALLIAWLVVMTVVTALIARQAS